MATSYRQFAKAYRAETLRRDAIEADLEKRLARVFRRQSRRVTARLKKISAALVPAGSVPLVAEPEPAFGGAFEQDEYADEFAADEFAADDDDDDDDPQLDLPLTQLSVNEVFMDGFDEDLEAEMRPVLERHTALIGGALIGASVYGSRRLGLNPSAKILVQNQVTNLAYVGQDTQDAVESALLSSYEVLNTFGDMAATIRDLFLGLAEKKAPAIARVEAAALVNGTAAIAARLGEVPAQRMWVTQEDERVRPTHEEAHGQVVGMDEPFDVGGHALDFPGDPDGPIQEIANCRCFVVFMPPPAEGDEFADVETVDEADPEVEFAWRRRRRKKQPAYGADFDESNVVRDAHGRFAEKEGGGEAEDLDAKVMGLLGLPPGTEGQFIGNNEDPTASAVRHAANESLATNMKSSTGDLIRASGVPSALGDDRMYFGRNLDGRVWSLKASEMYESKGQPLEGFQPSKSGIEFHDVVRGDQPGAEAMAREQAVSGLVDAWTMTTNDSDPKSLAVQEVARREFGLEDTADWRPTRVALEDVGETDESFERLVNNEVDANGAVYADFLRTQYDATQSALADAGLTEIPLVRGYVWADVHGRDVEPPAWTQGSEVPLRPISAWSFDRDVAANFAGGQGYQGNSTVVSATIPAERILAIPRTGMGNLAEQEFVVLGGTQPATIENTIVNVYVRDDALAAAAGA